MKFSPYVLDLLRQKSGQDLGHSSDCEVLALDIESVTREHIGVNTLKRLLGFIDDERTPRHTTLDIIAKYLDFDDWAELSIFDNKSNSNFSACADEIQVDTLEVGQRIQISYLPDRQLIIQYQGKRRFLVTSSLNSKLQEGDECQITHLISGYPLLASDVHRNGTNLGNFTAGKQQGISIKLL